MGCGFSTVAQAACHTQHWYCTFSSHTHLPSTPPVTMRSRPCAEFLLKQRFTRVPDGPGSSPPAAEAAKIQHRKQLEAATKKLAEDDFYDQFLLPLIQVGAVWHHA